MAFDPKAFLANSPLPRGRGVTPTAAAPPAFDPKKFLAESDVETRIRELGGVKQPDGTYLVPNEQGGPALRLDAEGNQLDAPTIGEESTGEAIGNRVLATAASGAQSLLPQIAGAAKVVATLPENPGEVYRRTRDETKKTVETARDKAGIGYDVAGAVLSGGLAAPETLGARALLNAGLAGVNAAASSDVDLTQSPDIGAFAQDVALGAGAGAAFSGVGEALGVGLRKAGSKASEFAAKAFARQEAADLKAIDKGLASLRGELGAETQKGSRLIENLQRGTEGIPDVPGAKELAEGVLSRNLATLPGQLGVIEAKGAELAARTASRLEDAAKATAAYFDKGLWAAEILPRIKGQAPRWGMAAAGMALGEGYDLLVGEGHTGKGAGALFGLGSTLSSPGMRAMLGNIAKSNRIQKAIGDKLAPILFGAAAAAQRGSILAGQELAKLIPGESALGPPDLVAEQIVAQGGLKLALGDNGAIHPDVAAANAPQSELDKAIQQTTGVTLLAGALEQHHDAVEKGLSRVFAAESSPQKHQPLPAGLAAFGVDTPAMLERLSENMGNLADVAPGVAAELAATSKRAIDYLAKVGAQPPRAGPMAPEWVPSAAEKRSLRLAEGVVASPMSVLDAAASGQLVPEQVAALNAVYPMLGRSIADAALSRLEAGAKVPYRARLMVGFLTETDVDGTFSSIGPNQVAIRAQTQKPSNQIPNPSQLTVAERTEERDA